MNFDSVTIVVRNMKKSLEFYKEILGFSIVGESEMFSELTPGDFKLGLHIANEHMNPQAGDFWMGLAVCFADDRGDRRV
jgi:catechol 2,3-dioxygenase-like lactoylglutathione lyase family enzyme